MKVPLVAQQVLGGSSSAYLQSPTSILSRQSTNGLGAALRTQLESSGDAIHNEISEKAENANEIGNEDNRGIRVRGYIGSALREITRLSDRIEKLQERIEEESPNSEQRSTLQSELETTTAEVERIVNSDPFRQAVQTAHAVQSSLQSGLMSKRSLNGVTSLLGDNFANLAASGSYGTLQSINSALDRFSGTTTQSLLENPGRARELGNLSHEILSKLRSAKPPTEYEQTVEAQSKVALIETPKLSETSFAAAGELALSLRSYQGKDLVRAVASGMVSKAEDLFQLAITPPKQEKDEEDDSTQRAKKKRDEDHSARQNGVNLE